MQRRRLLLALGGVVGEGGTEAATVGRICERAGVSRRTFYELFADREECLLAAFDAQIERLTVLVTPALTGHGSWTDHLRGALHLLLERFDEEPDVARLCVVESLRAGPQVLERRRVAIDAIERVVDGGRAVARAGSDPPPLTAQGVVGGVLSVIHTRLLDPSPAADRTGPKATDGAERRPLVELGGELMAMIVHPYLGAAAARRELARPLPSVPRVAPRSGADPFKDLPIRFTYRTARVLATIAAEPGASNRLVGRTSGIADDGQVSRLLARLRDYGLVENRGADRPKGEPNAWALTDRGLAIHEAISQRL
jgi:AcrR family transcriptional regulator